MSPRLLLLLFMGTVLAALPRLEGEGKPPTLTVSPIVNVQTLITANPLLKKLSMFSESPVKPRSVALPTTTPFPVDKKVFSRSPGDNFHALYKRLNESLFEMAEPEEKNNKIDAAEDALPSDDSEEWVEENEIEERGSKLKESIEEEPFAVTESLLTSLQPQETTPIPATTTVIPPTPPPNWEASPWTSRPPASRTFASLLVITEPVVEDEVREVHRNIESDSQEQVFKAPSIKESLVPLLRASEWQVQQSGQGRFLVSGTQFYEDNRINGGVMLEQHRAPSNQMEVERMRKDPRFAVEAELTRMRAHAAKLKQVERPIARAAKTVSLNSLLTSDHIERFPEKSYRSKTQIIERNGRKIELRTIDRQGKAVEVELSNPLLWHHDYISAPGAIIHGPLKNVQKRFKLTNVSRCFEAIENTRLTGAVPIDRRISRSTKDCLKMCTKSHKCRLVVFEESLSMCEIFSERAGEASFQESTSSTLFQPIVEDSEKCLATTTRAKVHAAPTVQKKKKKKQEEVSYNCPDGEDHVLTRQEGIRAVDTEWKEKLVTNEDDCVSACLNGPRICLAAGYSHETQECVIYSSITTSIEVHEPTTLYSKMCVPESTATKCSGATIEHVQQAVLLSSMREARKVVDKAACLRECLNTKDYTCMSVMFYPKEKTNCILNDGSLSTSPDSFVEELNRDVEYFGVDECYGIQDVTHRTNYIVEDDIRPGQVTSGSRLDTFLRS